MSGRPTTYRPEIDGLRAIAVLSVILFHAGVARFSGGFFGVDVFFVISGYLITQIVRADLQAGQFSFARFYQRRARRILPALFLVCAVSIVAALVWMTPGELQAFGESLFSVLLFFSNIHFWSQSGYFDTAGELKPLLHTWSLAVEEQFYLLYPLLLLALWRWFKGKVALPLLALAVLSFLLCLGLAAPDAAFAFYAMPTRGFELLAGAFCALLPVPATRRLDQLGAALGLCAVLGAVLFLPPSAAIPSAWALLPVVGTLLLLRFARQGTGVAWLLSRAPFIAIGLISYSAYLWHQPLFAFLHLAVGGAPERWLQLAFVPLTLVLAFLSWRFVEQPFRRRGGQGFLSSRAFVRLAFCATLFLLAVSLVGWKSEALLKARYGETLLSYFRTSILSPKIVACDSAEFPSGTPLDACAYFDGRPEVAVFGDSHAGALAYSIAGSLQPSGRAILQMTRKDCPPIQGRRAQGLEGCAAWAKEALALLAARPEIKSVVVEYRINAYLFGDKIYDYPIQPVATEAAQRDAIWQSYIGLLSELAAQGKRVVLVLQPPELPKQIERLLLDGNAEAKAVIGVTRRWWGERSAFVHAHLSEIPAGVAVIDPARLFCDDRFCYAGKNGIAFFTDNNHLTISGADLVAQEILPLLVAP